MPNCEICGTEAKNEHGLKIHMNKHKASSVAVNTDAPGTATEAPAPTPKSAPAEDPVLKRLEELEKRDAENQKTIQMLTAVADKGRVFNWESKQNKPGQGQRIRLSVIDGKYVVGWQTLRDELIADPRTGATVGELQQYEIRLLEKDGSITSRTLNGYQSFSNLRYDQQVECQVLSRSESFDGKLTFRIGLPDGREYEIGSQFIN